MNKPQSNYSGKSVRILECVCAHEFQDKRYGKGKRLHNPTKEGYRCTVCKREVKS